MELILYVRSGCPLCEDMEAELGALVAEYALHIERRYIDNDPALQQRYGDRIPVLCADGESLCEYFLDREKLLARLNKS